MPQRSKGARLWLRRPGAAKIGLDYPRRTKANKHCRGPNDRRHAEEQLAAYLAPKALAIARARSRSRPILIADAMSLYAADRGPSIAPPPS